MPAVAEQIENEVSVEWSARERRAWAPPERLTPSAWAERHRELTRRQSSQPGRWKQRNAPYLIIFDLPFKRPTVRKMNMKKPTQIGFSEGSRNIIGFAAGEEPDPALLVLPDESVGKTIFADRIVPLFNDTPVLAELQTERSRDVKNSQIVLSNGFDLKLGWSGSAASLAANPIRFLILDEVDKFALWSGREADPIDLAEDRTERYGNSITFRISTPTTRLGKIHELEEHSHIRMRWFVPCPACGQHQQLLWDRLKWLKPWDVPADAGEAAKSEARQKFPDKQSKAKWIEAQMMAGSWYECANTACGFKIRDAHKPKISQQGYWAAVDGKLNEIALEAGGYRLWADGHEEFGPQGFPIGSEVGIQISAMASLGAKHKFYLLAAEFIMCAGDSAKLMNFYNSKLGEVFEQTTQSSSSNVFSQKCKAGPGGAAPAKMVPPWVSRLLMMVDTQKDYFYFLIRGFGHGRRSQRIHHGIVPSFEDLKAIFYQTYFPYRDNLYPALQCYMMGIDPGGGTKTDLGGNRTDEVYRFCLSDPAWIKPLRGNKPQITPIRQTQVTYRPIDQKRSPYDVWLYLIDVGHFQDILESAVGLCVEVPDPNTGELREEEIWRLNDANDDDYNRQMSSMHKVAVRSGKNRRGALVERWEPKTQGAANHYRDIEVSMFALAEIAGVHGLPSPEQMARERQMAAEAERASAGRGLRTPDGRPYLISNR